MPQQYSNSEDEEENGGKRGLEYWGRKVVQVVKKHLLLTLLILSIFVGLCLGIGLRSAIHPDDFTTITYLRVPGELLMRMLKMIVLPLIIASLISGLAELNAKVAGSIGGLALAYYATTTFLAIILGIILVLCIRPGDGSKKISDTENFSAQAGNTADGFLDLLRNMFPENLVEATFKISRTVLRDVKNGKTGSPITKNNKTVTRPVLIKEDGSNILGLVVFSVLLGLVTSRMGPAGQPIAAFFFALNEAVMRIVSLVIWVSPIGIVFLIATEVVKMVDPGVVMKQLGLYILTIILGILLHGFVTLPAIFFAITRKNPFKFMIGISDAMVTAFGTSSSSATLPVTYRCLEENLLVDTRVTRFVLPVGATMNMDGTALYEAVAPIFIAQLNNIPMTFGKVVTISITATFAAIGAAGVPQAGLITMVIVMTSVGLPIDDIAKIIAVDWFLDRFRTMINVVGDSFGAGIVAHLGRRSLSDLPHDDEKEPLAGHHKDYEALE